MSRDRERRFKELVALFRRGKSLVDVVIQTETEPALVRELWRAWRATLDGVEWERALERLAHTVVHAVSLTAVGDPGSGSETVCGLARSEDDAFDWSRVSCKKCIAINAAEHKGADSRKAKIDARFPNLVDAGAMTVRCRFCGMNFDFVPGADTSESRRTLQEHVRTLHEHSSAELTYAALCFIDMLVFEGSDPKRWREEIARTVDWFLRQHWDGMPRADLPDRSAN